MELDARSFAPSFESKLDHNRDGVSTRTRNNLQKQNTSFFIKALEDEQEKINIREDKKAQIGALQAELDSPTPMLK